MSYWVYIEHRRRPGEKAKARERLPTGYPSVMDAMDAAWVEEQRRSGVGQSISTKIVDGEGQVVDFNGEPLR